MSGCVDSLSAAVSREASSKETSILSPFAASFLLRAAHRLQPTSVKEKNHLPPTTASVPLLLSTLISCYRVEREEEGKGGVEWCRCGPSGPRVKGGMLSVFLLSPLPQGEDSKDTSRLKPSTLQHTFRASQTLP